MQGAKATFKGCKYDYSKKAMLPHGLLLPMINYITK